MASVVVVNRFADLSRRYAGGNLNFREIQNNIFFSRDVDHGDSKRSVPSKRRSRERSAMRSLKQQMRSA
jgi:hypothetical protein